MDGSNIQVGEFRQFFLSDATGRSFPTNIRPKVAQDFLFVTDQSMPGMTGIELVQRLRAESFRGKIMVLSAHLSAENRAAYEALAVDAIVSKPFDVHELRATITRLANGIKPGVEENPVQLSPADLHNMLKTALVEEDESDDADQEAFEGGT